MKVAILAGGLGSRLGEETNIIPKPMVTIGKCPVLWHIMKIYSHYGFNEFVILTGYKHEVINEYFLNFYKYTSDLTVDLSNDSVEIHKVRTESWKVTLLYTGEQTQTSGRIYRAKEYLKDAPFMLTYGDGVGNIDIPSLIDCHRKSEKVVTLTAIQPQGRFGALEIDESGKVASFQEKPKNGGSWVNAGFMVCQPEIFNYIPNDDLMILEDAPIKNLTKAGQLNAYHHYGFWRSMDMLKDKQDLNKIWADGKAPWKIWNE